MAGERRRAPVGQPLEVGTAGHGSAELAGAPSDGSSVGPGVAVGGGGGVSSSGTHQPGPAPAARPIGDQAGAKLRPSPVRRRSSVPSPSRMTTSVPKAVVRVAARYLPSWDQTGEV